LSTKKQDHLYQSTLSPKQKNEEKHYINPREVSSLTAITDPNNMGNINRYVIVIKMNNADFIVYGRYWAERNRNSIIQYLINTITTCNNQ